MLTKLATAAPPMFMTPARAAPGTWMPPARPVTCIAARTCIDTPVAPIGWPFDLRPPEGLTGRRPNGGIFTTAGVPHENRWQRWSRVEGVTAPPGAPVTFLPYDMDPDLTPSEVNGTTPLFVTDIHGTIYATDEGGNLWSPVSNGKAAPGSPLTAVYDGNTTITLFVTAGDGTIWTTKATNLE
jgi:hypothetical protein